MEDQLTVREAALEDRQAIWEWWNDPDTRRMMKQTAFVPWDDHCAWYEKILMDPERVLCLGISGDDKIGVVRFDFRAAGVFEVSINLNPAARGKGFAPKLLSESAKYITRLHDPLKLYATLKKVNVPSEKSFAGAGFLYSEPANNYPGMESFLPESELYCELILRTDPVAATDNISRQSQSRSN